MRLLRVPSSLSCSWIAVYECAFVDALRRTGVRLGAAGSDQAIILRRVGPPRAGVKGLECP